MSNEKSYYMPELSKDGAIGIILLLDQEGEIRARDLLRAKNNYYLAMRLAISLKEIGLINAKKINSPRVVYTFSLTPKGKKVADKLKEIRKIIDSQ